LPNESLAYIGCRLMQIVLEGAQQYCLLLCCRAFLPASGLSFNIKYKEPVGDMPDARRPDRARKRTLTGLRVCIPPCRILRVLPEFS
jgi:hypothetical protein